MAKRDSKDVDYLEDAFDDEKNAEELEKALKSNRNSCLIVFAIVIVVLLALCLFSCGAIASIFSS